MTARDLIVAMFVRRRLAPACLSAAISTWMGWRAIVTVAGGQYRIDCGTAIRAHALSANFGGTATGKIVAGAIVDLTS